MNVFIGVEKQEVRADKGSKKWLQKLINEKPQLLEMKIKAKLNLPEDERIDWLSPLKEDNYREYGDLRFIERLGIRLEKVPLEDFWPKGGPRWDALGKSQRDNLFLVEAKSHISELIVATKATKASARKIHESLEKTRTFLNATPEVNWSQRFYQYTNRLAHLYLLRHLNELPTYLVFVYFINDLEMKGPTIVYEWKGAIKLLHSYLGIRRQKLKNFIASIFIDVHDLR